MVAALAASLLRSAGFKTGGGRSDGRGDSGGVVTPGGSVGFAPEPDDGAPVAGADELSDGADDDPVGGGEDSDADGDPADEVAAGGSDWLGGADSEAGGAVEAGGVDAGGVETGGVGDGDSVAGGSNSVSQPASQIAVPSPVQFSPG
jgi:hypothetical protein